MTAPTSVSRTQLALGGRRGRASTAELVMVDLDMLGEGYVVGLKRVSESVVDQAFTPDGCT